MTTRKCPFGHANIAVGSVAHSSRNGQHLGIGMDVLYVLFVLIDNFRDPIEAQSQYVPILSVQALKMAVIP